MKFKINLKKIRFRKLTRKFWYWFGGIFLGFILFSVTAIQVTSKSGFCKSCHYMQPFYDSWKESAHSNVECVDCHYAPGLKNKLRGKLEGLVQVVNYVSNAYRKSKPWAEIPDESCLRPGCHEKQLLNGVKEFKGVEFGHESHLSNLRRGKKLRCTSCHSQIVQGEHILVTETTCFICHFKLNADDNEKVSDCKLCHTDKHMLELSKNNEIRYDHTNVIDRKMECTQCHSHLIKGTGDVHKEQCYNCHFENERMARFNDPNFLHTMHITDHKIECNQCHSPIQHQIVREDKKQIADCSTCHSGHHSDKINLFFGEGGKGVDAMPNSMLESGINCRGCHIFHSMEGEADTYLAKPESCEKCHGKGFGNLMKQWEEAAESKIKRIEKFYNIAEKESKMLGKESAMREFLATARFNIDLVTKGKSVHNIAYANALLNVAYGQLVTSLKTAGSAKQLPSFEESTTVIPTECSSCHISLSVENLPVFGVQFSHEAHVIKHEVTCKKCHSNMRQHGELILTRKQCLSCHHEVQEDKECKECHEVQYGFFSGSIDILEEPSPDIMFEAELDCYSCHAGDGGVIMRSDEKKCVECHDDDYSEILNDWQNTTKTLLTFIDERMKSIDRAALNVDQKKELRQIELIIEKVKSDGSLGVHNNSTIEDLLSKAKQQLEKMQ